MLASILLQVGLSRRLTVGPRWLLPALEGVLLIGLEATTPRGRVHEDHPVRRRVEELPEQARLLLLVASADQPGDPPTVWDAANRLGIGAEAAVPATDTGLLEIGERVRFPHPLVRSAVCRAAAPRQRRAVHKALAAAISPEADPDRRAWHLAAATLRPDAEVAAELERSAGRAQVRGGIAAAAAFMERSAELTLDSQQRALRFLLAAGAYLVAGANQRAQASLKHSVPNLADPALRPQALRMEGAIRFADGRGGETPALLFKAATALRDFDRRLARETLLEALEAEGESNAAIAAQLFISPHTVAYHLRKVYAKLAIGSRSQLAAAIREQAGEELELAAPLE